jgi:two-component sensor histidine kinase
MDLEEVRLQVKSAIPIGLIVNELMTNSLKYAFPGGGSGMVSVGLHAGAGVLSLTVTDNGIGLPADFEERRSKGMGSMLIGMMVRQLKGSYTIEREKGALFRFTIPL